MPGIPTLLVSVCLSGGVPGLRSNLPTTVDVVMPLVSWSEADVFAYVAGHHLALPPQYAEGYSDSVECLIYSPKFRRLGVGDLSGAWIADRADCRSSQGSGYMPMKVTVIMSQALSMCGSGAPELLNFEMPTNSFIGR